jgi:aminopeptidase N
MRANGRTVLAVLLVLLSCVTMNYGALAAQPVSPPECHRLLGEWKASLYRDLSRHSPLKAGQEDFDVLHYALEFAIDPDLESMEARAAITLETTAASLDSVVLDFTSRSEMSVDSVKVDGEACPFLWIGDALRVVCPATLSTGQTATVDVWYHGQPETASGGFGFGETPMSAPIIWTLSEPEMARAWWPCKDQPADKATAEISVRVPTGLSAVSNGSLLEVVDEGDGSHTWVWKETYPIATYLVSLAISEYDMFQHWYVPSSGDSMPVLYYVYPEHRSRAEQDFRDTVPMIEFYASVFGEYPFLEEKYGMAEFPWGGAMEHQTITSYGAPLITGTNLYDRIVAHELAHQWWGDSVTLETWDDIWLNEGFAVYSEALWEEHTGGEDAYREYMEAIDRPGGFAGTLYAPSADPDSAFLYPYVYTVYDKGGWVLHMLRHVLGDSVFFETLSDYASNVDHAYKTANTAQFQALTESHFGESLDWFFQEWVYGQGRPDYEYEWSTEPDGAQHTLSLHVQQVQMDAGPFRMPLDVTAEFASGETTLVVVDSLESQDFVLTLDERPVAVYLDRDGWVLKHVTERPRGLAVHGVRPNPFRVATRIEFDLPGETPVNLVIYDVRGRRVRNLIDRRMPGARHEVIWDGRDHRGRRVAPGVYFGRLRLGQQENTVRLVVVR